MFLVAAPLLFTPPVPAQQADLTPKQWASEAAQNELQALEARTPYLRYRMHVKDSKGDQVRDLIQSRDGYVARAILRDNRPLTPEEDAAERQRLQATLDDPDAYFKHIRNESTGRKTAFDLLKQFPSAMLFSYAAGQPQRAGRPAGAPAEVVIDFVPDPNWDPPSMTAGALTGLKGRVWIDPHTHYMMKSEGTIFRGVNFGLGVLAHIFPGGTLSFEQTLVEDQRWMFSRFVQHLSVRLVLFKTIKDDNETEGSDFRIVREMSYQEAVKLLLATPLPTHP